MRKFVLALVLGLVSTAAFAGQENLAAATEATQEEAVAKAEACCNEKAGSCCDSSCARPVRGAVRGVAKSVKQVGCCTVESTARVVRRAGVFSRNTVSRVRTRVFRGNSCCN